MKKDETLRRILLEGWPDRVAKRREPGSPRARMAGGRGIALEPDSSVREAEWFLAIDPRDPPGGPGGEASVRLASALDREWLEELFPHLIAEIRLHDFDANRERIVSRVERRYLDLVISSAGMAPSDDREGAGEALAAALAPSAEDRFSGDREAAALLARVRFLARTLPGKGFPNWTAEALSVIVREAAAGCTSVEEMTGGSGWVGLLERALEWKLRSALDELAPARIEVPSGSRIRLDYPPSGEGSPVLAVRIQELFGLEESPRVAGGRVPVLLHLLGPNYRPAQVTSDLRNFWKSTYPQVRKELRARYPRHPWPEDPLRAPARAVGGRRRESR